MTSPDEPFKFYFHLKSGATKPAQTSGLVYKALCGKWVYDSIATDVDCPDRWVTCPICVKKDPHPEFRTEIPAALMRVSDG